MVKFGFKRNSLQAKRPRRPRIHQFLRMCEQVAQFLQQFNGQDFQAFFARDDGSIGLYLLTKAEAYDFELSRKLAEFAAPYIERGLFDSATLLPASSEEELRAFFDPNTAVRVEIEHA